MPWTKEHIKWLSEIKNCTTTIDGKNISFFEFSPDLTDSILISKWAKHFRNHYCFDDEINFLKEGTSFSNKEFLENLKFPTKGRGFGPGIRAGDFGEILMADYLQYIMKHWVPRTRYGNKTIRDESTKGSDLIGFKIIDENETLHDVLTMIEVKTQFSGKKAKQILQNAIDDSEKDELRKAESLNAIKQRLFDKGKMEEVKKISRFQDALGKPYTQKFGAAALFSTSTFDLSEVQKADTSHHSNKSNLFLVVVKADDFMDIVNNLYKIAADEA